jgi:hypothetical protein
MYLRFADLARRVQRRVFAKMTAPMFRRVFTEIRQGSDQDAALEAWDVRDQVVPRGSAGRAV